MLLICSNSRIEIWGADYINGTRIKRRDEDKNVRIIQIECGNGSDYIVEVIDKGDLKKEVK